MMQLKLINNHTFDDDIIHHYTITSYFELQIFGKTLSLYTLKSNMLQQYKLYIPEVQPLIDLPLQICDHAKQITLATYDQNLDKAKAAHKRALVFRKKFVAFAKDISWETVNEMIHLLEIFANVEDGRLDTVENKKVFQRLQLIYTNLTDLYIRQSLNRTRETGLKVYNSGRNYVVRNGMPLYIHLKAFLIVSQQMLCSFIENQMNGLKMSYESHKDSVVMFFSGNFKEEVLKEKLSQGIQGFKQITFKIVHKGLEVKVDRQSLMENYEKFAVEFLNVVKDMKEKSQENIGEVKKKSKDLYEEVVGRIRAKQLEIKTDMKCRQTPSQIGIELEQ